VPWQSGRSGAAGCRPMAIAATSATTVVGNATNTNWRRTAGGAGDGAGRVCGTCGAGRLSSAR
jgi:hypothetical protein